MGGFLGKISLSYNYGILQAPVTIHENLVAVQPTSVPQGLLPDLALLFKLPSRSMLADINSCISN